MDIHRFDELARALSKGASRRGVLGGLLAGLLIPLERDARGKNGKNNDKGKNKLRKKVRSQADGCWRASACLPGKGTNVSRCDLSGSTAFPSLNSTGSNLSRANLRGVNAQGANFTKANLSGACLVNANFAGATFKNTNLANAIFCNTTMPNGMVENSGCGSGTACCPQSCESDGDCPACQTCSAGACVVVAEGTACSAGDLCTINDSCQAGVCVAGPRRVCPTNPNQCKQNVCNAQTGDCEAKNKDPFTPCNDGNPCTTQDACNFEGECVGSPVTCFGGRICCPSGPYTGTCRGGDAANCSSNIGCCSDNCVFGQFCSF